MPRKPYCHVRLVNRYGRFRGVTFVDRDDYTRVKEHNWRLQNDGYVRRSGDGLNLQRFIVGLGKLPPNSKFGSHVLVVDHINRDRADNRKDNLRIVTRAENQWNRVDRNQTSKYQGVFWNKACNRWGVTCGPDFLGHFDDELVAAETAKAARVVKYGKSEL